MLRSLLVIASTLALSTAFAQPLDGRLKRIAESKTLTIAHRTDAAPFSFIDANKQVAGFTIDLCKKVAASIERQLKLTGLTVRYVPVTAQNRFEAIAKGRADMECGATTVSLSRMKVVDFSSYVFLETTGLMAKSAAGLQSFADLAGKRIGVIGGTTNERAVRDQLAGRKMTATVVTFTTTQEAIAALDAGSVDAYASDALLLVGAAIQSKDPKSLMLMNDKLSYEPYGIVLPLGDHAFRLAVNTALSQIYRSEDINEIFNRWFAQFGKPTVLTEAVYILGSIPE
jgi:ABC-type amino acid transport substrate-binding protein